MMRNALLRSRSTHHAKSSKAAASNSKLLTGCLKRDPVLTLPRFHQTAFHRLTAQEIGGLSFGGNFTPQLNRDNDGDRVPLFVRHVLNLCCIHPNVPPSHIAFLGFALLEVT